MTMLDFQIWSSWEIQVDENIKHIIHMYNFDSHAFHVLLSKQTTLELLVVNLINDFSLWSPFQT